MEEEDYHGSTDNTLCENKTYYSHVVHGASVQPFPLSVVAGKSDPNVWRVVRTQHGSYRALFVVEFRAKLQSFWRNQSLCKTNIKQTSH